MKGMTLNISEQMLFALLRASLHQKEAEQTFFQQVSEEDWKQCCQIAISQGVMALAWDGVMRLPKELHPAKNLKLTWAMAVERYEAKYLRYCKTVDELSAFYAHHGITTVQLKGVGFSTYYPVPSHREGGDIDIYTYSSDKNKMSDADANALADTLMKEQGIEVEFHNYKHSNFYYKGIPIENHKSFLDVKDIKEAVLANEILQSELKPRSVELVAGKVQIPSPAFNALFIAFHTMRHYGGGMAFHHLCDWAMILKHFGLMIPGEMKGTRFYQGIMAITRLCNDYLGTNVPIEGGEKLANEMIQEIFNPKYEEVVPVKSKLGIILYKTGRLFHVHRLLGRVFDISLRRRLWRSIKFHIRNPKTIFGRKEK